MRKCVLFLFVVMTAAMLTCCAVDIGDDTDDITVSEQGLVYTGNYCWFSGSYNDHWVDPNNPGSGEHVVGWYDCYDEFYTYGNNQGYWQVLDDQDNVTGWMVWPNGNKRYQVFVDGWYYWPRRLTQSPSTIFSLITLR